MDHSANREAVVYFEQALAALHHLPECHDTTERGIDLRFDLRNALSPLGERERILGYLREAETLVEALDDHRRRGRLAGYMAQHFNAMGDYDRAIASGQHALTLATTLGDLALVGAQQHLGCAYQALGDYRRASEFLSRNVTSLAGICSMSISGEPFLPHCVSSVSEYVPGCAGGV